MHNGIHICIYIYTYICICRYMYVYMYDICVHNKLIVITIYHWYRMRLRRKFQSSETLT